MPIVVEIMVRDSEFICWTWVGFGESCWNLIGFATSLVHFEGFSASGHIQTDITLQQLVGVNFLLELLNCFALISPSSLEYLYFVS